MRPVRHRVRDQEFLLFAEKAAFWPEAGALLIADPHFGKGMHFRKAGVAVPAGILEKDLRRLDSLLEQTAATTLIVLGDFFHSDLNSECALFAAWRQRHGRLAIEVARGNHDVLNDSFYATLDIRMRDDDIIKESFLFRHAPPEQENPGLYTLSGHVHPAVRLVGNGQQSLTLPCFHFGKNSGHLPAFGGFTGFMPLRPQAADAVFVIAEGEVVLVQ